MVLWYSVGLGYEFDPGLRQLLGERNSETNIGKLSLLGTVCCEQYGK